MPNLTFNPASLQSASNILFRREKKDIAPALSAAYRNRMRDDPRHDSIRSYEEGAANHIPHSGWAGALAQVVNGYMAGKERRSLEKDYLGEQQRRQTTIDNWVASDPTLDPMVAQMAKDPEFGELAIMSVFKNKLEPKEATKYSTVEKPDGTYAWDPTRPDAPMTKLADAKPAERKTSVKEMVGSQGPGQYLIDDATGEEIRKVGGIYNKPSDRQPTDFDRRYLYYKSRGMDDQTAHGMAVGGYQPVTDPVTGQTTMFDRAANAPGGQGAPQGQPSAPPGAASGAPMVPWREGQAPRQAVVKRAEENDALDQAITRLDNTLAGEAYQEGVGPKSTLGRAYNRTVRPFVGGEGFPESDQVKFEAEALKQTMVGLLQSGDKRIVNEDFKRLESLIPNSSMFEDTRAARQKLAEARKLLVEIRNRPLAGDPRSSTQRPAQGDPMGMGGGNRRPTADPLGLFE